MAKLPRKAKGSSKASRVGGITDFLNLYGEAVDTLVSRLKTVEPFSPDLAGAIEPTLRSLVQTKNTMLLTVHDELSKSSPESHTAFNDQVQAVGAPDLLRAAIAAGHIPKAEALIATRTITMTTGALRIPWLEIIKEILSILLDMIPGIPAFLIKLFKELLKILDKLFGGMPHEDNTAH